MNEVREMVVEEFCRLAVKYDLQHLNLQFTDAKRKLGTYRHRHGEILISNYILQDADVAIDTIRHEIAHAIDWSRNGTSDHSDRWKAIAKEVGARPSRTVNVTHIAPPRRYELYCPKCDRVAARMHRRARIQYIHKTCGTNLTVRDTNERRI